MRFIPFSMVLASFVVPLLLARRRRSSARTVWITIAILVVVWQVLCIHVYPHSVLPE